MLTPDQKLQALEWSLMNAFAGETKIVHCPYCNTDLDFTPPGLLMEADYQVPLCCSEFALASIAILQRLEQMEAKEMYDRIRANSGENAVFN